MLLNSRQGRSLLELLIVLGLITLLLLTSYPLLTHVIANTQAEAETNKILQALKLARHEAINNKKVITLCLMQDTQCLQHGTLALTIFHDKNNNRKIDEDEEIIRRFSPTTQGSNLKIKASFARPYFRFKSDGSSMEAGSIFYCPKDHEQYGKVITLNYMGRAYLLREENARKTTLQC